jgi:hypothetical protein
LAFLPLLMADFALVLDEAGFLVLDEAGFLVVLVVFFLFADKFVDANTESLPSSRLRSIYILLV